MTRYALVLKETGEVTDIKLMDGVEPEINSDVADQYEVFPSDTLQIGMVRGGKANAVDGFGFSDEQVAANRSASGVTRIADAKAAPPLSAVSHEKQRGMAESPSAGADEPARPTKGKAAKGRKAA